MKINKQLIPVSPLVIQAREFTNSLIINCVYYITQICDLGQSDINKLMFLNASRIDDNPVNVEAYKKYKGGVGRMIQDAINRDIKEPKRYFNKIFPVLRNWFKYTEFASREYLEEVWNSCICEKENEETVSPSSHQYINPDKDFKKVVILLIMTKKMKLTHTTVLRYINGNFCPIEFLFNQLCRRELVKLKLQQKEFVSDLL